MSTDEQGFFIVVCNESKAVSFPENLTLFYANLQFFHHVVANGSETLFFLLLKILWASGMSCTKNGDETCIKRRGVNCPGTLDYT